jgi:glycosyltransferase involved in cell wall biosynthesis
VTRYARLLLEAMAREFPGDRWQLFVPGRAPLAGTQTLAALSNVSIRRHALPGRAVFGAAAVAGRPRLDRLVADAPDVVWAPTIAPLALSPGVPLVLTVQDLSFELRPRDFTAYERVWHRLARPRALARRAHRVIVLASPVRDQLIDRWGVDGARIRVVAPGVDPFPAAGARPSLERFGLGPGAYLLAVGALEPRKAPQLLVRAFVAARAQGLAVTLAFAGEGRLAPELRGDGVMLLGRVGDPELEALYRGAVALVVPSLLEGFGLPLREALARGTPAVISDLPAFGPELDPAVLRVAPGDEAALAAALLRVVRESGLRGKLAAAAPATVSGLSWTEAARRTRAVFAEAASG